MDFLQIALIFLIILLAIFLSVSGIQVFFILKDLKKTLDNINNILSSDGGKEKIASGGKRSNRLNSSRRLFKNIH